jgi:hypothetical protein
VWVRKILPKKISTKGGLKWVSRAHAGDEGNGRPSNVAAILSIFILLSLFSFGQLRQPNIYNALDLGYSYTFIV